MAQGPPAREPVNPDDAEDLTQTALSEQQPRLY